MGDRLSQERLNAMFDAVRSGGSVSADELKKIASEAEFIAGVKRGQDSEKAFDHYIWACFEWLITSVDKVSKNEDQDGIDRFITFNHHRSLELLKGQRIPVQIKSSDSGVEEFRNESNYIKNFNKKIIVINCGPSVGNSDFRQAFISELERIKNIV